MLPEGCTEEHPARESGAWKKTGLLWLSFFISRCCVMMRVRAGYDV